MEYKELKTIEDIINAVHRDNLENFLIDFKNYLEVHVSIKSLGLNDNQINKTTFRWLDDREHCIKFKIEIVEE